MNRRKSGLLAMIVAGASVVAMAGDALPQADTESRSGVPGLGGSDWDRGRRSRPVREQKPARGTLIPERWCRNPRKPGNRRRSQNLPALVKKGPIRFKAPWNSPEANRAAVLKE